MIGEENNKMQIKQIESTADPIFKNHESNRRIQANTPSKALQRKKAFAIATSCRMFTIFNK